MIIYRAEKKFGELSTVSDGNISGVSLIGIKGKKLVIGYKNNENETSVKPLIAYDSISENAIPYIKNTASGSIFPNLSGGGIVVNNGLITRWNIDGVWSGTYYLDVGSTRYRVTVSQGLMTGIEQV